MDANTGIILLMTATVDPLNCPKAKFTPSQRLGQYRRALAYNVRILQMFALWGDGE